MSTQSANNTGSWLAGLWQKWIAYLPFDGAVGKPAAAETAIGFDEIRGRIDALPESLRLAFLSQQSAQPLHGLGTEAEEGFRHVLADWRDGRPAALILHAAPGGGKTSQLGHWFTGLNEPLVHVKLDSTISGESDLTQHLAKAADAAGLVPENAAESLALDEVLAVLDGQIVVIERMHNLFLRAVGHYQALEVLLSIIVSRTKPLWVLSLDTQAYCFIERLFSIDEVVTDVLALPALDIAATEAMLDARFGQAGIAPEFCPLLWSDTLPSDPKPNAEVAAVELSNEQLVELKQQWLKQLWSISKGHPTTSLFYAVSSLRWDAAGQRYLACKPERLKLALVEGAKPSPQEMDRLLVLTSVLTQGEVAVVELASTLGWDPRRVATSTFWLLRRGVLEERQNNMLRVNPVFVGDVDQELRKQHLVY